MTKMPCCRTPEDTTRTVCTINEATRQKASPQPARNTLRVCRDHSAPHHGGILATCERFLDGPAAQLGQHLVVGDAPGVRHAEHLLQPLPEIRQSHAAKTKTFRSARAASGTTAIARQYRQRGEPEQIDHDPRERARRVPPKRP